MTASTKAKYVERKRQQRGERRIADIVSVASRLFAQHGIDGTTMYGIAQKAGITTGSLYQYFPTKEAIADAVAQEYAMAWKRQRSLMTARSFGTLHELAAFGISNLVTFFRRNAGVKAFLDADPRRARSIRTLDSQIEGAILLLESFYPGKSHAEIVPVATIVTMIVENMTPKIARNRSAEQRRWLIAETTNAAICYVESKLGDSKVMEPQ